MQLGKKYKYLATLISQKRLPAASIVFKICKVFEIFSIQGRPGKNIQTADQSLKKKISLISIGDAPLTKGAFGIDVRHHLSYSTKVFDKY